MEKLSLALFFVGICLLSAQSYLMPGFSVKKAVYGIGRAAPNKKFATPPVYYDITPQAIKTLSIQLDSSKKPIVRFPENTLPSTITSWPDPKYGTQKQLITQYDDGNESYIQIDFEQGWKILPNKTVRVGPTKMTKNPAPFVIQAAIGGWTTPVFARVAYSDITDFIRPVSSFKNNSFALTGDKIPLSQTDPATGFKTINFADPIPGTPKQLIVAYDDAHGHRNLVICFEHSTVVAGCVVNGNLTPPSTPIVTPSRAIGGAIGTATLAGFITYVLHKYRNRGIHEPWDIV